MSQERERMSQERGRKEGKERRGEMRRREMRRAEERPLELLVDREGLLPHELLNVVVELRARVKH